MASIAGIDSTMIKGKKLNKRQKKRIEAQTSLKPNLLDNPNLVSATVIAQYRHHTLVNNASGDLLKCALLTNLGNVVPGDCVLIDEAQTIQFIEPRRNIIQRPTEYQKQPKLIAANVDEIFIMIAPLPAPIEHYIDRFLVLAHHIGTPITLIANKQDLPEAQHTEFQLLLQQYSNIGYPTLSLSVLNASGLQVLREKLCNKISLCLGQSGVGKSTLTKALTDNANIQIQTISERNARGKHTTTTAYLHALPNISANTFLIDTPGIREFSLTHLSTAEILSGFKEFQAFLGNCKFRNCTHTPNDLNCAIVQAIEANLIAPKRLVNYHRLCQGYT